ncbi:MAG TPA: ABC transporter substrate-binding protein [Trueperaceae bacterium]
MKRWFFAAALVLGGAAVAQQDVTITWMGGSNAPAQQFAAASAQRYMDANPHTINGTEYNVTIEFVAGPESTTDRLSLYLQYFEAQSPEVDLMNIDVIWPGDLAAHLVDLYQYEGFEEAVEAHFPAIVENNTVDGELVGIPLFTDAGLLYYRSDLLEEYGYDGPPSTWDELEEMARTIQEGEREGGNQDFWGFVWQGNAYEGLTCDALEWVASHGGGTIISPDGVITINNERAIAAIERAAGWVGSISPEGVTGFLEEDARGVWQAGNAAFMRNWPYAYVPGQDEASPIRGKFGVAPLPAGEGGSPAATLGGWQLAVNAYSDNPAVAADVALHLTSYEEQVRRAIEVSNLPTIEAVYEDPELLNSEVAWFADLLPVFQNAVARPSTVTAPQYGETSRIFFTAVHDVLTGQEDAGTALAILELDLMELHPDFEVGTPE